MIRTRTRAIIVVALLGAGAITLAGCVGFHGPKDLRKAIARNADCDLDREFGISTNGLTLGMARGIADMFVDEPLPPVKGVSKVEFGEYRIVSHSSRIHGEMLRDLPLDEWTPIVRVRNLSGEEEMVVFAREKNEGLRGVVFAQREGNTLTLARVTGNLEKFLVEVLRHEDFAEEFDLPFRKRSNDRPDSEGEDVEDSDDGDELIVVASGTSLGVVID